MSFTLNLNYIALFFIFGKIQKRDDIMEKAFNYLNNLLKENDRIVVCLSGGPDSMCLLSILLKLRETKKLSIIAAHINHNVRKASAKEALFVEDYCNKNNVIFETMKITNYNDDNFHNDARNIRYKYFEEIVKKYNAKYLMTAHHADDLIETILMRLVRGSNLNGYAGFKKETPRNKYIIIRPLIENTKDEILLYNKQNNIPFVIDKSNKKSKYTRNRYRKVLLPFLKNEDPNVHEKFLKFSDTITKYNDYFNKEIANIIKKCYKNGVLNIYGFSKYNEIIQTRVIENILENIYDNELFLVNDIHTKEILNLIKNKLNKKINLPKNLIIQKNYNDLIFSLGLDKEPKYSYELKDKVVLSDNKVIKIINKSSDTSNYAIRLLSSEIKLPLIIRNRQDGDKIMVKKLNGSKKIKDIFIDEKVSLQSRDSWPILVDSKNTILWIPGLKKSKFDKSLEEKYDIIIECNLKEKKNEKKQR